MTKPEEMSESDKLMPCRRCDGRGYFPGDPEADPIDECSDCNGRGRVPASPDYISGFRAGLEAAAKVADEFDNSHNDGHPGVAGAIARAIRALQQKEESDD